LEVSSDIDVYLSGNGGGPTLAESMSIKSLFNREWTKWGIVAMRGDKAHGFD